MKELINIELDGLPPTVNHMYIGARSRRFRSKECKDYQEYVINKIVPLRAREWPYSGCMALTVVSTAANKRRFKEAREDLRRGNYFAKEAQVEFLGELESYLTIWQGMKTRPSSKPQ